MAYGGPDSDKYSGHAIGSSSGYSISQEEVTLPSLLKRLDSMVANSGAIICTASEIRQRICGARPEVSRSEPQTQPSPNGLLNEMQNLIDSLALNLERLQDLQNAVYSRIT